MISPSHWRIPPPDLALSRAEVHVWRASLEQPPDCVQKLAQVLSYDEMARVERFHFECDRRRFVVGRGVLRVILGRYLDIDPRQVQLRYGEYGKPYLVDGFGSSTLLFNLAHSHELALYAFTRSRQVGIDIECARPLSDAEEIVARFFSARERAVFRTLPKGQQLEAFYDCWTRKEAYLKATGKGLAQPLDQFDVSLAPGESPKLLRAAGYPQKVTRWSLQSLAADPGYVAALAVEGQGWQLMCWQWSG